MDSPPAFGMGNFFNIGTFLLEGCQLLAVLFVTVFVLALVITLIIYVVVKAASGRLRDVGIDDYLKSL